MDKVTHHNVGPLNFFIHLSCLIGIAYMEVAGRSPCNCFSSLWASSLHVYIVMGQMLGRQKQQSNIDEFCISTNQGLAIAMFSFWWGIWHVHLRLETWMWTWYALPKSHWTRCTNIISPSIFMIGYTCNSCSIVGNDILVGINIYRHSCFVVVNDVQADPNIISWSQMLLLNRCSINIVHD